MIKNNVFYLIFATAIFSSLGVPSAFAARVDALDPTPIDSAKDPDNDRFVNDWRTSKPRRLYEKLIVRDILTKLEGADAVRPARRGAVLVNIRAISRAELPVGAEIRGRAPSDERQVFYTASGDGTIVVKNRTYTVRKGTGFTLTSDFEFVLRNTGKTPIVFYVRTDPMPENFALRGDIVVVQRFDNERRVGNHWNHIGNGGPSGMSLITIAPHTIPHPHSHAGEECWLMVEGETVLMLGKKLRRMQAGQAYKIPPTGITAHSNLNVGEAPVQMIFMGPITNARNLQTDALDYSMLDAKPFSREAEPDIDMFIGNWRDSFPRVMHGNMYFRDLLTSVASADPAKPLRKAAVLSKTSAVSQVMIEAGSTAHPVEGELVGQRQVFVVESGTGKLKVGDTRRELARGVAFVIMPGLDFELSATGEGYLTLYAITQKTSMAATTGVSLQIFDGRTTPSSARSWSDVARSLIAPSPITDQSQLAVDAIELPPLSMSRPTSAGAEQEEIWIVTSGELEVLLGKQLRKLSPGMAYRVPPTGSTPHANINVSGAATTLLRVVE